MKTQRSKIIKPLLLCVGLLSGLVGATWLRLILTQDSLLYRRDFICDYLPVKAYWAGFSPYRPLPELAAHLQFPLGADLFQHPSPHSPGLLLLSLPIGWLNYQQANWLWTASSLCCLFAALFLLLRQKKVWGKNRAKRWPYALLLGWSLLGFGPLAADLATGQIDPLLLLLAVSAWFAWRDEREQLAGGLLGGWIALKLLPWPFLLYFALRRRWRLLASALGVFALIQTIAAAVFGVAVVKDYYLTIGPLVGKLYRGYYTNLSLGTTLWRFFRGNADATPLASNLIVEPLFYSPALAWSASLLAPVALLSLVLWLAWRASEASTACSLLLGASLLLGPVCWFHYFTLLIPVLLLLLWRLYCREGTSASKGAKLSATLIILLMALPHRVFTDAPLWLVQANPSQPVTQITFAASLLPLLPALLLGLLLLLVWRIG